MDFAEHVGARVAFDPVGRPAFASLLDTVATEGTLIWYGVLSSQATPLPFSVLGENLTIAGYALDIHRNAERRPRALESIYRGVVNKTLTSPIAQTFPLTEAARAHATMESNEPIGKLLLP